MSSPMSDYSYSQDSKDFLSAYSDKIKKERQIDVHQSIVKDFGESYERAYQLWNTFYAEAYKDLSFYLGNQWSLEELSYLNNSRRSSFTYNKIRRIINLIQGYQRKNRLSTIVSPIENSSEQTAEIFTDVIQHVMQTSDGYQTISDAFKGALTTGISFVSPWVDYRNDPINGDIKYHLDDWNGVILDPFFTKLDLSDCTFIARRKYLSRSQVISLLPDKEDIINGLPWGSRDDKFTYMPYARQWGMQKLLNYTEYWRRKWVVREVLVDMETGETIEWKGDKHRLKIFQRLHPSLQLMKKPVQTVELGIIVEGELLYYGKDPWGLDDYPFVPFISVFEPSYDLYTWKLQSLVRILRDPQTELNKRRSKMVDLLDSQLNSGWIAKTGAVTNNSSLFKTGNGQVIFLKPEAQMSDIQRIEPARIDPSNFQLEAEFDRDLTELVGTNSEMLGMAENDKIETAAILSKMRQAAGLINLQDIFDNLRHSQKILGRKTMQLIQANYSPEKIMMITKKEITPEFYTKQFAKYDITVDEGVLTDTQRQSQFMHLMALKQIGIPVPDSLIISNSNLHGKKELTDILDQQAQAAAQQAEMQNQLAMQNQQTVTESLSAKADSDRALAAERLNKVGLDAALNSERLARAEEDRTAGVLNLIKAIKELESMDVDNIVKMITLFKDIEQGQKAEEQKEAPPSQAA